MSTRYNTGNPIESTDVRDMSDNAKNFDEFSVSTKHTFSDRLGVTRKTIRGMNAEFDYQILIMGFARVGTFATGATLTNPRQVLLWDIADGGDGQEYGWSGTFPKIVPPSSTPSSTGGIAVGAWMSRFDPELRVQVREALRRSYAEAGLNLADGSFELGSVLSGPNDVLLCEKDYSAWAWVGAYPHNVPEGTIPVIGSGYVPRTDATLRSDLASESGSELVGYQPTGTGAVATTVQSKLGEMVSVKDFGAVGDGVTDDTSAITAWFDYVIYNGKQGFLPSGTYRITSTLVAPTLKTGWSIVGQGRLTSIIEMATDNVPIITFGDADKGLLHTISLLDIGLNYTNDQAGNTSANCIYFRAVDTWNIALRLKFIGGYWGIKIRAGANAPWGCNWDLLEWGSGIKGGAIDSSGSTSATPNNVWGRFGVDAKNMTEGTIFKELKGYNNSVGAIEIFGGTNGLRLMSFQAGAQFIINSLKCETITLTGELAANTLISAPVNGVLQIGTLTIGGTKCVLTPSVKTYVLSSSGVGPMFVKVGFVGISPSQAISNIYLSNLGGCAVIDYVDRYSTGFPIPYTNLGGSVASENLTVSNVVNDHLSQNKGDADYTVSPGDPTNILFETPMTTVRTVTLPGADGDLFNGMRYRIISDGAINGANTINIASDGATRATLTVDKAFVDLMYRRHATGGAGWKVIGRGTI